MAELPPVDPLAEQLRDNVLQSAKRIREDQLRMRDQAIQIALAQERQQASPEASLANEVDWLRNRMTRIYEHPLKSRIFQRSGLAVVYHPEVSNDRFGVERLSTSVLTDGAVAHLEEDFLLFSGISAWIKYGQHREDHKIVKRKGGGYVKYESSDMRVYREVHIDQVVTDESTKQTASGQLFKLATYDTEIGRRVEVSGGRFDAFLLDKSKNAIQNFIADNDWAKGYVLERYGHYLDINESGIQLRNRLSRLLLQGSNHQFYTDKQKADIKTKVEAELVQQFEPGNGWEYPEDFFLEPLGIVKVINMLLGQKQKK